MAETGGGAALALAEEEERRRRRRRRRCTCRIVGADVTRGRQQQGARHHLVQELRFGDARFAAYFRLNKCQFEQLLRIVAPSVAKLDTKFRQAVQKNGSAFVYGDSFRSVAFGFRVGASTVAGIVHEVCAAIWTSLLADYMPRPDAAEWRKIAAEFSHLAFPNCLGAMDGKHVVIEAPPSSGSLYYNYKGTFSIVLLAVVDAKYRFRVVDIGAYGRNSDGGTLSASAFGTALRQNTLGIPADCPLPGAEHLGPMPHVFLADEAFPLRRNIMRPYPGHNFRLSHVRRMVECAFGILASQWRVYRRVLGVSPEVAENIVKATSMTIYPVGFYENTTYADAMVHKSEYTSCFLLFVSAGYRGSDCTGRSPEDYKPTL
ncbi:hypothetical protein N1851_005982 [Merluccius polli]|uniref:DDE Tnp4 domain-containing protein n=1 Tax=Merluccius polli TaxID=89951 RepID=A0AA47PAQ0_MERPO|nr:hypothetical protein N1851_005982 [Merluccius polli]